MDIRLFVVVVAIAVIMDIIGRMARKRAGEEQVPPGEEWDMLNALTGQAEELQRRHREGPGPAEAPRLGEVPPPGEAASPGEEPPFREVPPRVGVPVARQEQRIGGFEVWSESPPRPAPPEVLGLEPTVEPVAEEPVFRDRTPRPPVAREPVFRERSPRPLVIRSGDGRLVDEVRSRPAHPSLPPRRKPATRPDDRFGLRTVGGLRNAIVAREVLGPPLALRDGES